MSDDSVAPAVEPLEADNLQVALTVADVRASSNWYCGVLGFAVDREHEREGRLIAVSLRAGAIRILLAQDNGAKGSERVKGEGFSFQITTRQSIDALAARATQAGATLDTAPMDALGVRIFRLRDPDGFRMTVSTPRAATT